MIQEQPPEVFCKKRCSLKFGNIPGKRLYRSLFTLINLVAGLQAYIFIKKRL